MEPVRHPCTNRTIGPPKDWDAEKNGECASLEVLAEVLPDGGMCIQSAWMPNDEERQAIALGSAVCLGVYGTSIPPMFVGVFEPAPERKPQELKCVPLCAITAGMRELNHAYDKEGVRDWHTMLERVFLAMTKAIKEEGN